MRVLVVGLGIQGAKRARIAGSELVGTVDPVNPAAGYRDARDVPLDVFDAALVCVPDDAKLGLLEYLIGGGKHVLVEKPLLADDDTRIRALDTLARRRNVVCYTAYNHRFEPHIARVKEILGSGRLGRPYAVRMFYGNGTARDVRDSPWRDKGSGVLPDLGSHLLDTALFLFGRPVRPFERWSFDRFENKAFDHVLFGARGQPRIVLEGSLLSWRNSFSLDIHAERGSVHVECLCKWGPSTLTVRGRVLPSGRPPEEREVLDEPDPTWAIEYEHFKRLCAIGATDLENDLWINQTLKRLAEGA